MGHFLHLASLFATIVFCESANILYAVPFTGPSHQIFLRPIGLELAARGHNVTVITARKETNHPPTFRQVINDDIKIWELLNIEKPNVFTMVNLPAEVFHNLILWNGGLAYTEMALNSTPVQEFLKADNQFDLVIVEQFYNEAMYALAYKFNAPLVLINTFGNCMKHNIVTRNPLELATALSEFLFIKEPTSFWGRFRNWYFTVYEYFWWRFWYLNKQEQLVMKYVPDLPKPVPSLYEIQQNVSIVLANTHFSFDQPKAFLPNIIEVGGLHLSDSTNKLPQEIQEIMDNAKNGVVYVNFGSNVQSSELPKDKKQAFLNTFRKLKQTVIWKWEDNSLIDKPDNVYIKNWLPQKEIFSHPNIKVFISHGGLIGTQEATYHGVPIIGIPIYADQYNNLLLAQEHGFGRILEFHDINEAVLSEMLNNVLKDDTFKNNAKLASARFRDRPMTALNTAMYWIEYVIRNKGAKYMKNRALELSWIEYMMLDIYASVLTLCIVTFYIVIKVLKLIYYYCYQVHDEFIKTKKYE